MDRFIQALISSLVRAWIFILCPFLINAQEDIFWTPEATSAYELISELRIEEGMNIVRLQEITYPGNLIWPYLHDYGLFLQIFINEDIQRVPDFLNSSALRIDRISVVPETNPLSLMCQAQLQLHQCALRLQHNQYAAAATDMNQAFRLLRKNQKLHPDDYANLRLYASLKIAFGAIPDQYRWLVSMVTSLEGTIDEGINELNKILAHSDTSNNIFHTETVMMTALAEGRLNNKPAVGVALMNKHFGKTPANKLVQYVMANLQNAAGDNDAAIRTLALVAGASSAERLPFLDYMMGKCKLSKGNDDADIYFKNFLLFHKGENFIKGAHQKLAWYNLLKEDRDSYFDHMQLILIKGANSTDEDHQAMIEAETNVTPHPVLLRARLYFDGGYYEKASSMLNDAFYSTLTHRAHRLEYLYRKGRLLHAMKSYAEALHYYSLTIRSGEHEPYYFACSAALHCGIIHESLGSEGAAERYYLICLQINPDSYATSLHQKARTGLSRMGR